ncbi:hypothetical protein CB0940_02612 [Cercospora beticola]|uniref:Uncharacterized protein n=1 Tax=Cercospora beticola TaxID=122368 RepID=A0A2G5I456_CERBT|nr:hypothetical protein CB0940_02612 [Cercospora beticola]PIA99560.1 hypothetical protein CB0940_02612 [Cercospora beticola]
MSFDRMSSYRVTTLLPVPRPKSCGVYTQSYRQRDIVTPGTQSVPYTLACPHMCLGEDCLSLATGLGHQYDHPMCCEAAQLVFITLFDDGATSRAFPVCRSTALSSSCRRSYKQKRPDVPSCDERCKAVSKATTVCCVFHQGTTHIRTFLLHVERMFASFIPTKLSTAQLWQRYANGRNFPVIGTIGRLLIGRIALRTA